MAEPTTWGRWTFDEHNLTLVHEAQMAYEIDLEECTTSAETLDWIAQVAGKQWIASTDLGDLVRALDELIGLQENLCSFGRDQQIHDVRELIDARRAPMTTEENEAEA